MREMFKDIPFLDHVFVEHLGPEILISAPQNVIMRAHDDADRIKLNKPYLLNDRIEIKLADRRIIESLR